MNKLRYWLWLSLVFAGNSRKIWGFVNYYSSAENAYRALTAGSERLHLSSAEQKRLATDDLSYCDKLISEYRKKGIGIICYESPEYPAMLKLLSCPPAVLYYKGNIGCFRGRVAAAVVGARKTSEYGLFVCDKICRELVSAGILIVSGFAVGTDITAHLAAVSQNSPTACILGCGIDYNYPRENEKYRDAVLNSGGVFISEFPPGTSPKPGYFPIRNRILAGLSHGIIIIEASEKSGSLVTANIGIEEGRSIYCLPPANILSPAYAGNIMMLSEGAEPIYSISELIRSLKTDPIVQCVSEDEYDSGYETDIENETDEVIDDISEPDQTELASDEETEPAAEAAHEEPAVIENDDAEKAAETNKDYSGLTDIQQKIINSLSKGELHADLLAEAVGTDAVTLMMELTELEIMGSITSLPGKMYRIK